MKILLLNDTDSPIGGAELMTLTLKNEFQKAGHEVRIFSSNAASKDGNNFSDYHCFGTLGKFRTLNRAFNFSAYWELNKVLKSFKPDVVHIRMFFTQISPSILPLLKNTPTVYHATWLETVCPKGSKLLPNNTICKDNVGIKCFTNHCLSAPAWVSLIFQNKLFHAYKNHFNAIVANSNSVKNHLLQHQIAPIEVIYNGVPDCVVEQTFSEYPSISCASRLSWEKGIDILIAAFAKVVKEYPKASLIIAGDGPEKPALEKQILQLNLQHHIRLIGQKTRIALDESLSEAWVHVVPSRWEEGFGLTAAEAMMRGKPVIASKSGGLAEIIIDHQTGFLIDANNQEALETKLLTLFNNKNLAIEMGEKGKKRAKTYFTETICANNFLTLYQQLLSKSI